MNSIQINITYLTCQSLIFTVINIKIATLLPHGWRKLLTWDMGEKNRFKFYPFLFKLITACFSEFPYGSGIELRALGLLGNGPTLLIIPYLDGSKVTIWKPKQILQNWRIRQICNPFMSREVMFWLRIKR